MMTYLFLNRFPIMILFLMAIDPCPMAFYARQSAIRPNDYRGIELGVGA